MKFKKLEIFGFKSFADKLEVKFGDGVTAIVGPNGCGKSNVADSIRWVLGEQSAKLLRGSNMQDVIFNGTEKRKSLSYCEVSLHFDNTEGLFPSLDYSEVVVSRKLYRSGESMYYINNNQCRLRDVTELLRDGGMGREGYSIIGQGRIDELLSAKPEDRRAIFEEAAGISKFKARKIESERKLIRTRENMVRIDDILAEKARQLEPLSKQAEAARKYNEFYSRLKSDEINVYLYQTDTANQAKEAIGVGLAAVTEEISVKECELNELSEEYRGSMASFENIDSEMEKLREKLVTYTVGVEKRAGELRLQSERAANLRASTDELRRENEEETAKISESSAAERQIAAVKAAAAERLTLKRAESAQISSQYGEISDRLTAGEDEVNLNRKLEMDAMDKLSDIKSNMSRLLAEKEAMREKAETCAAQLKALTLRVSENQRLKAEMTVYSAELEARKDEYTGELCDIKQRLDELSATAAGLTAKIDERSSVYHTASAQFKMLKSIKETNDAYNYSVRNLLADAKTNRELSTRIEGVVAELLTVPQRFETAVEMALGGAFQYVVTRDEDGTKYLINYLKSTRRGRVTFLPVASAKPRTVAAEYGTLLKEEGVYGVASDLVGYDKRFERVFLNLLGATVVVDNIEHAIRLAKSAGYNFRIVTLEGDIINTTGAYTGGSIKGERNVANIFTHERELKELTAKVDAIAAQLNDLTAERDACAKERADLERKLSDLREIKQTVEVESASKQEALGTLNVQLGDDDASLAELRTSYEQSLGRAGEIASDIGSVGELEALIAQKRAEAGETGEERRREFELLRRQRDDLRDRMSDLSLAIAGDEAEVGRCLTELERLKAIKEESAVRIENNKSRITMNNDNAAVIERLVGEITAEAATGDGEEISALREKIGDMDAYKKKLSADIARIDDAKMKYIGILNTLNEKKASEELKLHKVDADIENMEQRIDEEYHLTYEQCFPFRDENFEYEKTFAEVNKIKRQIGALGTINPDSIDMCKKLYEEYSAMNGQREDLVKAEGDLVKIIRELSEDMLKLFADNFEKIRVNFVRIFKELFDGGNADLLLLESEDPLAAGIEIVAQPPQKKLQSISLLSGGERALTAIAILFAILRLRPMPFCVLDEIEAALDDANAGRFAKYLRRFSEETQFIVITHRKPTMELADNLYGVTMEEKGVSKIVSVKLSEAVAQAESAVGA